uniref:Sushi domain-containing protein n=1 Tax=Angiostrongylus cantonensis TaxID=6313 RepID=A0A0K0D987_ANGCA
MSHGDQRLVSRRPIGWSILAGYSRDYPTRIRIQKASGFTAVTVWTREFNGSFLYRISDEDLSDEGYHRGTIDREDVAVLLARSPERCTFGVCTLALSTNEKISDGIVSHQENKENSFTSLPDTFFCARRHGDCGAQRPVFRFTKGSGLSEVHAYSFDPKTSFAHYSREAEIFCYAWVDNESIVHPMTNDSKCLLVNSIANGKIRYSSSNSSIYSIGTTATLECDEGYVNGGQSTVLCVKSGWYPASGLGYCVEQNNSLVHSDTSLSASSSSMECAALGKIRNGQLTYSGLAKGALINTAVRQISYSTLEPYTPSTTATMSCDFGLSVVGASMLRCTVDGWFPPEGFGVCGVETAGLGCLPVIVLGGTPSYVQSNLQIPFSSGTSVLVVCNAGYTPQGTMSAMCENGIWTPPLGVCILSLGIIPGKELVYLPKEFVRSFDGINSGLTEAACPAMAIPLNGYVTYSISGSDRIFIESGVTFTFLLEYFNFRIDGTEPDGVLLCGNPIVANGIVTYSLGTPEEPLKEPGTVALMSCNLGFVPIGSTTSTCQNGVWMPALGICSVEGLPALVAFA